jgi:ribonuclease Y
MGEIISAGLFGLALGAALGFFFDRVRRGAAYRTRDQILKEAEREADALRKSKELEAKEDLLQRREELERQLSGTREELREQERKIDKREAQLEEEQENLRKRERMIETAQNRLAEKGKAVEIREKELDKLVKQEQEELYKISGLSRPEATDRLLQKLENELKNETGSLILKQEQELKQNSERLAREIVGMAVQRYASTHTSETTVSTVDIPSDEMKGRIIGREGRNIRAFEKETGVDVIVDDTPGVVVVSAFDTVRREVAKISMQKLIQDGRIHPSRIEEIVRETQKEMDDRILMLGREAAEEAGVGTLKEKVLYYMGRLHFRTSYSQNVLRHSIEVAFVASMMAEEMGYDADLARRAGLLHDIGKAADHDMEGGHPQIGADLLKRYGEGVEVVHAALGHHDDIRPDMPYTVLVAAADACSASRPGARRETLDRYIKRMQELESIATGFDGVEQAFAIQAGREVRVIASTRNTTDESAAKICRDIAIAFEQQLTYPGEIKVTMIRESRFTETAK